ncbi:hypothetical protein RhiTH_008565 [Rhizoctonia solani]
MSFTRRYYSTDRPPVSERNRPYVQALQRLSARTGTPLPSLILSFGVLHELTSIIPLAAVFFGARAVGAGDKVAELVPAEWIQEGEQWAGRVGRRYGLFGFEKTDKGKDDPPAEVAIVGDVANAVLAYVVVKASHSCFFIKTQTHIDSPNQDARVAAISVATKLDGSDVQALDVTSPYHAFIRSLVESAT